MAFSKTIAVFFMVLGVVNAFWRLPCRGRTAIARIDPLVQYGRVGDHAHAIHGGSGFGFTAGYEDVMRSNCTSCAIKQDLSVYWAPALYFQHDNGDTDLVKQVGGMLVYYLLFGDNIVPFPPGFQVIAGETSRRNFTLPVPDPPIHEWKPEEKTQSALRQKAVGFNCMNYRKFPEPTLMRHFLPDKAYLDANCPDGVRMELMFPSCWNGQPDSPDHMSHVAYPDQVKTGNCPKGYERRLVSLLYESIWDTNAFRGKSGRFIIANGDTTGYGYHGDFINGWNPDFLAQAIKRCTSESGNIEECPLFEIQSELEQTKCKMTLPDAIKDEDCTGRLKGLPGASAKPSPNVKVDASPSGRGPKKSYQKTPTSVVNSATVVPTLSYSSASTVLSNAPPGIDVTSIEASFVQAADEATSSTSPPSTTALSSTTSSSPAASTSPTAFAKTTYTTIGNTVVKIYVVQKTVMASSAATDTVPASSSSPSLNVKIVTETVTAAAHPSLKAQASGKKSGHDVRRRHILHAGGHLHHGHHHHGLAR